MIGKIVKTFGIAAGALTTAFAFSLFLVAYASPTKSITIPINRYGEANLELIPFAVATATVVASAAVVIKDIWAS